MKRKTKILISALSVMFVAAIAVAIASFSFAGDGDKDALQEGTQYVASAGEVMGTDTIIDYIIENSHSTDDSVDKVYHIAEITSSTASTLETYVSSDGFKNYVIDGNRTIEQLMAEGCVEYRWFRADLTNPNAAAGETEAQKQAYMEEALLYISNADFVYVSNDAASKFTKTNDLTEDLYDALHEYAVGSFKPIVIDSPSVSNIDTADTKTMQELAKNVFSPNEKYYYTFAWPNSMSAESYLSHASGSLYLGINGKTQRENGVWIDVAETDPAGAGYVAPTDPIKLAKILTITTDGSKTKTTELLTGCTEYTTPLYDANQGNVLDTTGSTVYELKETSIMYQKGYNSRVNVRPKYIQNDVVTLTDANTAAVDFDAYDMIVIEDSCISATIPTSLYKKFASAMYGKLHIVYSKAMGEGTASSADDVTNKRETNYLDLFYMVATSDYTARYDNVMVTNRADFSIITTSESAKTAKVIADLINASMYRGIGGSSSASSMFTVLELQPCYPIDEQVAEAVGQVKPRRNYKMGDKYASSDVYGSQNNYYTVPADMVNGKTKEQLPTNTEYYAWELSKAKLSDALGIPYDKINLVQMSTEEFAGDKTEILGTYDMIYIGGNYTALKDKVEYYHFMISSNMNIGKERFKLSSLTELPIYRMYSHNGDVVHLAAPHNQNFSGSDLTGYVRKNGQNQTTFTYLNGNDITYNRYLELKNYIDKGMPVVISEKLTTAYNIAKTDGYLQNSIDPDSNMYKVLQACDAQTVKTATSGNNTGTVVWDFNPASVIDIASDGTLGDTRTGYVSVFASSNGEVSESDPTGAPVVGTKELLNKVYLRSAKRPKMVVKSMPPTYNRFDPTTRLSERTLSFTYDVKNSTNYTVSLYVDDDGNSKFNRSTSGKEYKTSSTTTTLSYTVPDSFYGPVYWMIELVDNDTGLSVNQTGFAYINNKQNKPQYVSVLQIMPENGSGVRGNDSLYFCTACQRASEVLSYNPCIQSPPGDWYTNYMQYYGGGFNDSYTSSVRGVIGHRGDQEIYIGKHQHIFGINSYDSNITMGGKTGMDDWETNLADEIKGLFEFDLDIVTSRDFEQMSQDVRDAYTNVVDEDGNVTITTVSLASMKEAIKKGPNASAPDYDVFEELKIAVILANTSLTSEDEVRQLTQAQINTLIDSFDLAVLTPLYVQKKKCDYAELAAKYKQLYEKQRDEITPDAKEELDKVLDEMIKNATFVSPSLNGQVSLTQFKTLLNHVKKTSYYFDYYMIGSGVTLTNNVSADYLSGGKIIDSYISDYYHATDLEMEYNEKYKKFAAYAAGTDWIEACYSTVVLGPSESFDGDDIKTDYALDDLEQYIQNQNQVVLFHDTLTYYNDNGAAKLTDRLRPYFGMDRYHMQTASDPENSFSNPVITDADSSYVKYTSTDSDRYFMTNLSYKPKTDDTRYASWTTDMGYGQWNNPGYLTDVAYTDTFNVANESMGNMYAMPYKYAELYYSDTTVKCQDTQFDMDQFATNGQYGTNKVSQNNQGLVTTFPFTIAKELNVGPTHGQAYALDLEDDDMTVWYSLAAGNSNKAGSSMYAASPRDAMDNYFLYSYKNVFYCGAGHSDITGVHKDNNDERYLFINILCNSVRLSMNQPRINVFDFDKGQTNETNNIVKPDGNNGYIMKVSEDMTYPEFNLKVITDTGATLSGVKIYYDLDYKEGNTDDAYMNNDKHILIANWDSRHIVSGQNKCVFRYDASLEKLADASGHQIEETYIDENGNEVRVAATALKLKPEYFAPYNNEYTYIVIEATDSEGNKVYQRIKLKMIPHLFDLT